jgi:hypothetical protein
MQPSKYFCVQGAPDIPVRASSWPFGVRIAAARECQ